jgi:hypothetical protein
MQKDRAPVLQLNKLSGDVLSRRADLNLYVISTGDSNRGNPSEHIVSVDVEGIVALTTLI